jgi:hypothetical protein
MPVSKRIIPTARRAFFMRLTCILRILLTVSHINVAFSDMVRKPFQIRYAYLEFVSGMQFKLRTSPCGESDHSLRSISERRTGRAETRVLLDGYPHQFPH